jgi:hypothetical protein
MSMTQEKLAHSKMENRRHWPALRKQMQEWL